MGNPMVTEGAKCMRSSW